MAGFVKTPTMPVGQDFRIVKNNGTLDDDVPLFIAMKNKISIPVVFITNIGYNIY